MSRSPFNHPPVPDSFEGVRIGAAAAGRRPALRESQRDSIIQPRVAAQRATLGHRPKQIPTPTGLNPQRRNWLQLLQSCFHLGRSPSVAGLNDATALRLNDTTPLELERGCGNAQPQSARIHRRLKIFPAPRPVSPAATAPADTVALPVPPGAKSLQKFLSALFSPSSCRA